MSIRLSIRLAGQFLVRRVPITITDGYDQAIRWAVERLAAADVELDVSSGGRDTATPDHSAETGTIELDGYRLTYEVIDGSILHGRSEGYLGLPQIERQIEIEDMVLASVDREGPLPAIVVDASQLEGISSAARRP